MVRQMLWLFISVMISHAGLAKDPFDKTRRQGTTQASPEKQNSTPNSTCHTAPSTIFPQTAFEQIQVIGVLQHHTDWQVILLADNQVSFAHPGDLIASEHIQISKIDKQYIDFLRWSNSANCEKTTPFQLRF
ncbi:competence protein ComD [Aggregatibacter sp.]